MRYAHLSYLMDTDWVVYYLRNSNADVVKRIREYQPQGIGISIITLAELYAGVYYARNIKTAENILKDFLSGVDIVLFTPEIAVKYGREYARLRRMGMLLEPFDLVIGVTCLEYQLTLLTNNRKHYQRLEDLNIISSD